MEARMAKIEELVKGLPTKSEFGELRSEMRVEYAALRVDVAKGQADMQKAIADNHRWTHGALIGFAGLSVAGILGMMGTIWSIGKPSAPPAPQPSPVTITVPGLQVTPTAPAAKP